MIEKFFIDLLGPNLCMIIVAMVFMGLLVGSVKN